ncbi:MAG: hypothetical protein ABIC82_05250 [bacterium]
MQSRLKYLLIIILAIFQLSFFKGLGQPWHHINLLLCATIFWIMYGGIEENFSPIIAGALILDLFNGHIFGTAALSIFFTCFLVNLTYLRVFTNQSLAALLALGAIGILLYNFFIAVFFYFFYWINVSRYYIFIDAKYWNNLIWQIIFISMILTIFYRLSDLKFIKNKFLNR